MANVEFNTNEYRFNHGAAPRGIGSWAFATKREPTTDQIFFVHGASLTEAKKAARLHFKGDGLPVTVFVLP